MKKSFRFVCNTNRLRAIPLLMVLMLSACSGGSDMKKPSPAQDSLPPAETEELAQYDIAMTVRSMASSIEAGEALDASVYDFNGCLTDGRGVPLYTDSYNRPGTWSVKIEGPDKAVIKSLYTGDLFPDDLRLYIVSAMNLTEEDIEKTDDDTRDETEEIAYDFGPGILRFETTSVEAPDGSESPLLAIYISRHES